MTQFAWWIDKSKEVIQRLKKHVFSDHFLRRKLTFVYGGIGFGHVGYLWYSRVYIRVKDKIYDSGNYP